ncbi:MAG: 3-oxoacyl-ACP synthase, partial [Phototrophicales bacterium]
SMPMLGADYRYNGRQKNTIHMNGRQVFRFATKVVSESIEEVLKKANLTANDVDLIVPHQANIRIIETAAKRLNIDSDKFFVNVDKVGNTSAASIP